MKHLLKHTGFWIFLAYCGAAGLSAEEIKLDWSFLTPGQPISRDPYGNLGYPVLLQDAGSAQVVAEGTDPSNPFGEGYALFIAPFEEVKQSRLRFRPFQGAMPTSGSVEFPFQLQEGAIQVALGPIEKPWDPSDDWAYIEKNRLLLLRLEEGRLLQSQGVANLRSAGMDTIASGTNYTLKIQWESEGEDYVFTFFINGEPVESEGREPFAARVPQARFEGGSLAVILFSGSDSEPVAKGFIGPITVQGSGN